MRAVTHGDVAAVARALLSLAPGCWRKRLDLWITHAHAADKFRKRTGRRHRLWGNGSLMDAVPSGLSHGAEPPMSDRTYLQATAFTFGVLAARRRLAVSHGHPICYESSSAEVTSWQKPDPT